MILLEDLLKMWQKDCVINDMALDDATRDGAKLHGKYLELLSVTKLQLKRKEMEQQVMLRDKWLYFSGKMTKEDMDSRGWPYDPFNGLKIMKSDMSYFFNSDPEMQKADEFIEYLKVMISTLEDIIGTIRWRHQSIKNMLEWRKFTSGG
jgi:hypothetical protein